MKKVELLAPAGNYEAMTGAFMAGADAVYLGGNAFGARAYADNFSKEEIVKGIYLAHMLDKKIYLTVNTLIKEKEFPLLYDFLLPFYENGLDGIIIQDLGVFSFVKEHFPGLDLHVSIQMTITGSYGAKMLKEEGAVRIVPARELSLKEMKQIKNDVDIEIETFVHGAMCYCYSGQCLFSSILGGRSGNRGRCAQPCRLPYQNENGNEQYPLSMKDMCTISILPELMEAGIDSFKIEGRMKKPEYAAGVTALYRKYIDLYYENPKNYKVNAKDLEYLKKLYIRSDIQEGYYHMHNGKSMITFTSPAYAGSDDRLLIQIREKYLEKKPEFPVSAHAVLLKNCPAVLTLTWKDISVTASGSEVQKARKQPLSKEKIRNQLSKSGNTDFTILDFNLESDDDIFMPVSTLNQLRRDAFDALAEAIKEKFKRTDTVKAGEENFCTNPPNTKNGKQKKVPEIHVLAGTEEQIKAAVSACVSRIYIDKLDLNQPFLRKLAEWKEKSKCEFYLAFPYIVRNKNVMLLEKLLDALKSSVFDGALVRNLETVSFLEVRYNRKPIVTDCNLYAFNKKAKKYWESKATELYLPIELNRHEWKELLKDGEISAVVYGRIPMMITANCLKKSTDMCSHQAGYTVLKDRYRKEFPIYTDCTCCYNIVYNSVPLSLHKIFENMEEGNLPAACRLDFSDECGDLTGQVIRYFQGLLRKYKDPFYKEFTTGHYRRGVE